MLPIDNSSPESFADKGLPTELDEAFQRYSVNPQHKLKGPSTESQPARFMTPLHAHFEKMDSL